MKKEKCLHPILVLLIAVVLWAIASTLETENRKEDQQAQVDCRIEDDNINFLTEYTNE